MCRCVLRRDIFTLIPHTAQAVYYLSWPILAKDLLAEPNNHKSADTTPQNRATEIAQLVHSHEDQPKQLLKIID